MCADMLELRTIIWEERGTCVSSPKVTMQNSRLGSVSIENTKQLKLIDIPGVEIISWEITEPLNVAL